MPVSSRDVAVQRVGRLEHGDGAAMAPVGEAQRLEDLVRAVGREHLLGLDVVEVGDGGAQLGRGAVRVAMPLDPAQLAGEALGERGRRRLGRLVGVEPHLHVDLRRVVALHRARRRRAGCDRARSRRSSLPQPDRLGVRVEAFGFGERDRRRDRGARTRRGRRRRRGPAS